MNLDMNSIRFGRELHWFETIIDIYPNLNFILFGLIP